MVRIYDQGARPIYLVKRTANLDATDAAGGSATLPARSAMEAEEDKVLAELSGLLQELKAYRRNDRSWRPDRVRRWHVADRKIVVEVRVERGRTICPRFQHAVDRPC